MGRLLAVYCFKIKCSAQCITYKYDKRWKKRQMGTFQSPVTYYLCSPCSEMNNISFIDERAVMMPSGLMHIAKLQVLQLPVSVHSSHLSLSVSFNLDSLPASTSYLPKPVSSALFGTDVDKYTLPSYFTNIMQGCFFKLSPILCYFIFKTE